MRWTRFVVCMALPASVLVSVSAPAASAPIPCTIRGTDGKDQLVGTQGEDVICGMGGADRINGRGGGDRRSRPDLIVGVQS
jgi:hypothetical protein